MACGASILKVFTRSRSPGRRIPCISVLWGGSNYMPFGVGGRPLRVRAATVHREARRRIAFQKSAGSPTI
eukprot:3412386-Heterocapsa_arctica.AAC.1